MIGGGRRQSIYFRALASLVVMALLSMGTAFCLFYPQELRSVYERVEQRRANALAQTVQAMDKLLDQVYQAALMIEKEDTLRPYALSGGGMALYEASEMVKLFNSMLNDVYMTFYYVRAWSGSSAAAAWWRWRALERRSGCWTGWITRRCWTR